MQASTRSMTSGLDVLLHCLQINTLFWDQVAPVYVHMWSVHTGTPGTFDFEVCHLFDFIF